MINLRRFGEYLELTNENTKYDVIKRKAIENAKLKNYGKEFIEWLENFYNYIDEDLNQMRKKMIDKEYFINGKKIIISKIELSGSFGQGKPTPESDVDVKLFYVGNVDSTDVAMKFAGRIGGRFGAYDAHAEIISG